ncbi:MAG TPA: Hsp20/alpha crystallin family protein [Candidatus Binataceae bacterium]|jgi:HSP20 family protein|nr:Hsp20/alpha crystallin family protein [Candidatus Binataceae bacterium]
MSKRSGKEQKDHDSGTGGFLSGLAEVLGKLSELAESGHTLSESGEFDSPSNKEFKGVYGFNVKVGLGDEEPKVEPFGNIKLDRNAREGVVVREVREPAVDMMEESDHVLIVAEMPGISESDLKLEVHDDVLIVVAEAGDKKYRKEVLLPKSCPRERMTLSCNNGIVKIRCPMQ